MKLHYAYTPSLQDYMALADITAAPAYRAARRKYLPYAFFFIGLLMVAAYTASISRYPAIICIFLGALFGYIYDVIKYKDRFWKAVYRSLKIPKGEMTLDITEDGIHQTCEQIRSFAPWSSVTRYFSDEKRIMIELSSRLWTIVPAESLTSDSDPFTSLNDALRKRVKGAEQDNPWHTNRI